VCKTLSYVDAELILNTVVIFREKYMAGFQYRKSMISKDQPTLFYFIIDNSDTITIGDAVMLNSDGHIVVATSTEEILGIVQGVVSYNAHLPIDADSGTTDTYTVDSDNETVDMVQAAVIMDKYALFSTDSSGTLATTNLMQFFDLTDEDTINQGSASDTTGQFQLISLDPDGDGDASKGLFRIAESMLDPYAQA
jgi:hypothetical protein